MKDAHLTVRLPASLVRALARRAKDTDLARSHLVREAVTAYLAGPRTTARAEVTAAELADRWRTLPRLSAQVAAALGADLTAARDALPAPRTWE